MSYTVLWSGTTTTSETNYVSPYYVAVVHPAQYNAILEEVAKERDGTLWKRWYGEPERERPALDYNK